MKGKWSVKRAAAGQEEQRYAWSLATASPEDTVTQIYAEAFSREAAKGYLDEIHGPREQEK